MEFSDKAVARRTVRELLRQMRPEERASGSVALVRTLCAHPVWQASATVMCFAPLNDEPDIMPAIDEALSSGKTVSLPRFDVTAGVYGAACIASRGDLAPGRFGALEPGRECPVADLNQLDLILVPGVAFDLTGRRLGRGKGFYDRMLAQVRGHKCGVAFDRQLVARLAEEPHDVRVDSILTPTQWLPARAD